MNKKIRVEPNEITFQHRLYSVIIPKNDLKLGFDSMYTETGLPMSLNVLSRNYKLRSPLGGVVARILYINDWIWKKFIGSTGEMYFFESWTEKFYHEKNIRPFLNDLQKNGYEIKDTLRTLDDMVRRGPPKESILGTPEWKRDKIKLVLIVIFGIIIVAFIGLFITWIQNNF